MSTLIVTLAAAPADTATEYACVLTADGRAAGEQTTVPAALLPAADDEVVAVVPVRLLSWHRVELPKGSTANPTRLRAVLEGLLEERLLDEPERLHFALEPGARAGAPAWVAVCDRDWLRGHVQALEAAGRRVSRIVPEFAPDVEGAGAVTLHVIGEPGDAWRVTTHEGGVITLPLTLPLHDLPEEAGVVAEPAVAALAEQLTGRPVSLRQAAERQLLAAQSNWDLAQFDLASTGGQRALKKASALVRELLTAPQWRPARWGVGALVAINLLGLNAWAWKEQSALQAKRGEIAGTLTRTFPGVKVVVDAPVQMERELARLRQSTGAASGGDLESLLGAVSTAAPPGRPVTGVEYSAGEIRVRGLGLSPDEAGGVTAALRTQGYSGRLEGDALVVRQEGAR
jgi:general secretion pathway protein L